MKKVIDKFGINKEITIEIPDHDEMARVVVTDKCRPQITNTKIDFNELDFNELDFNELVGV